MTTSDQLRTWARSFHDSKGCNVPLMRQAADELERALQKAKLASDITLKFTADLERVGAERDRLVAELAMISNLCDKVDQAIGHRAVPELTGASRYVAQFEGLLSAYIKCIEARDAILAERERREREQTK